VRILPWLSVVLVALGACQRPALAAGTTDVVLISFNGFDYQDPNPSGTHLDVGEGYKVVGFVTSAGPLLSPWLDPSSYEYTIYIRDLTVSGRSFTFPYLTVTFANNGRFSYYGDRFPTDGGTAAAYGMDPPNATVPSTFIDGTSGPNSGERITGRVDHFELVYDFSTNQGSVWGDLTPDGGPDLIYVPPAHRAGCRLGGLLGVPSGTIPAGYDHRVEGEFAITGETPATHRTWGSIQALYRY
jgi:hypothetical protein